MSDVESQPPPDRRRAAVLLGVLALAAALVVGVLLVVTRHEGDGRQAAPEPTITSVPTTTIPRPTASHTPSATPTPHPRPRIPHEAVAPAAPTSFAFHGPAFTIRAHVCGMDNVRPLDPPGEQHHTVCWVQRDFGYAPGTRGQGTTYVLGHAWGQDPLEVLNKISEAAMRELLPGLNAHTPPRLVTGTPTYPFHALDGYVLTLTTPSGVLKYRVRSAYAVPKSVAANVAPLMDEQTRNRVVLITCGELDHVDYDYNIIVNAYLWSSKAATT